MTKDEALKLALEFIERVNRDGWILADFEPQMYATITAIKKALAQPEQTNIERHEANVQKFLGAPQPEQDDGMCMACENNLCTAKQGCVALDNPPQRTWVGLTDEEIDSYFEDHGWSPSEYYYSVIKDIENKLKQKNDYAEENT